MSRFSGKRRKVCWPYFTREAISAATAYLRCCHKLADKFLCEHSVLQLSWAATLAVTKLYCSSTACAVLRTLCINTTLAAIYYKGGTLLLVVHTTASVMPQSQKECRSFRPCVKKPGDASATVTALLPAAASDRLLHAQPTPQLVMSHIAHIGHGHISHVKSLKMEQVWKGSNKIDRQTKRGNECMPLSASHLWAAMSGPMMIQVWKQATNLDIQTRRGMSA